MSNESKFEGTKVASEEKMLNVPPRTSIKYATIHPPMVTSKPTCEDR